MSSLDVTGEVSIDGTNMLYNKIIFKHLPVEIHIIVSWCLASLVLLFIFYSGDELSVCLIAVNIYLDATKLITQCAAPTF